MDKRHASASSTIELCDGHGIVFICDEVQTGFGRTGVLFATDHYAIEPARPA